ncbi:MAG: DUF5765 domain-containing protein [Roseovarius sp.]
MCWSLDATAIMVAAGAAGTGVLWHRRQPAAIWLTLGYFTGMEALQLLGYLVVDQCGTAANTSVTLLSYLHIALQPVFINAFAMELVPAPVKLRVRRWVFALSAVSAGVMLAQILPVQALGQCHPGAPLCGSAFCTVSGDWHIAWDIPYNGLLVPFEQMFGLNPGFPTYMATVFLLPLLYGAWRFVLVHLAAGPVLAWSLTSNPNEMPAIWCLFSVAILCISLSPFVRRAVSARTWWGMAV